VQVTQQYSKYCEYRSIVLGATVYYRISRYFVPLGFMYPPPQNYVFFRTTRLQNECQYLILWQENPGISLKRQVIWIPHVESQLWMYNSNHQKTSLNLHFPLFELSARCPFFTDSLYPSDIFDELVVGFLHPSMYIWGVQNTEKYGSSTSSVRIETDWIIHFQCEGTRYKYVVQGTLVFRLPTADFRPSPEPRPAVCRQFSQQAKVLVSTV
jgi:hypothetical protein